MASAHLTLFLQPAVTGPLLNGAISTRTVTNEQGVDTPQLRGGGVVDPTA